MVVFSVPIKPSLAASGKATNVFNLSSRVVVCGSKKSGKTAILEQAIYAKLGVRTPTFNPNVLCNKD